MRLLTNLNKLDFKYKLAINLGCLALGMLIIAGSLIMVKNDQTNTTQSNFTQKTIDKTTLSQANGKDGNECLVAIESTVYKIEGSDLWKNGEHTTSNGLAYCGKDLTEVLKQSPHGKSKLQQLEIIGTYKP